ncbi:ABC transporter permease [Xylanivirga thermophila]|jgi:putative aldouronate transport system permease protein|uniref:ABC transporter permease n=1 Tax=Xylanivirga thermophila TaxID=2496273 RepID=UPI00101DC609|nr:ABC transporter permease subunit [Xylanivirga thermophila]
MDRDLAYQRDKKNIIKKDFIKNRYVYLMALPILAYYIIFCYIPMYGVTIAFKDFSIKLGILKSPWAGFKYFKDFFNSYYCLRVIKNTLLLNLYDLLWGFPAPIILALLLNELRNQKFKRCVQTVTYLPHFVSMVVICGIIIEFVSTDGLINVLLSYLGIEPSNMLTRPELFRTIYISSGIWQGIGWGSIIYLAALTGIDPALYEAATIDGAGRWKQTLHVTLPGIAPTIIILLILRLGSMMSVGFEKILLLYNPMTYETADVISTYVYRKGLLDFDYSYSAAVGLFNSIINFLLLIIANTLSRKLTEESLW